MRTKKTERVWVEQAGMSGYVERPLPQLPKSKDAQARRFLFAGAVVVTVLALALAVASIGGLLSQVVGPWVGYPGALTFDFLWVWSLVAEWEARTDHRAALIARAAGVCFMAASMSAIVMYGDQIHRLAAGIVLALVPAAVKGMWAIRLRRSVVRLPGDAQALLDAKRNEILAAVQIAQTHDELDDVRLQLEVRRDLRRRELIAAGLLPAADAQTVTELSSAPVPAQVPQAVPVAVEPQVSPVPSVPEPVPALVPQQVRRTATFGTDVTGRTEALRGMIAAGYTELSELRAGLEAVGFAAPSESYLRRLIREAAPK